MGSDWIFVDTLGSYGNLIRVKWRRRGCHWQCDDDQSRNDAADKGFKWMSPAARPTLCLIADFASCICMEGALGSSRRPLGAQKWYYKQCTEYL